MTRKDFRLIADTIRDLRFDDCEMGMEDAPEEQEAIRRTIATALATTNPRFDRDRFIAACLTRPRTPC